MAQSHRSRLGLAAAAFALLLGLIAPTAAGATSPTQDAPSPEAVDGDGTSTEPAPDDPQIDPHPEMEDDVAEELGPKPVETEAAPGAAKSETETEPDPEPTPQPVGPITGETWQRNAAGEVVVSWQAPSQGAIAQNVHLSLTKVGTRGSLILPAAGPDATQFTISASSLKRLGAPVGSGIRFKIRLEAQGAEGMKNRWSNEMTALAGQPSSAPARGSATVQLASYNIALNGSMSKSAVTKRHRATSKNIVASGASIVALQESVQFKGNDTQLPALAKRVNAVQKTKISPKGKKDRAAKKRKLQKSAKKTVKKAVRKAAKRAKKRCSTPASLKHRSYKSCVTKAKKTAKKKAQKRASKRIAAKMAYKPWKMVREGRFTKPNVATGGESVRIVYDSRKVRLLSKCPEKNGRACTSKLPRSGGIMHQRMAQYAQFQDKKTKKKFWVVSIHLDYRSGAKYDSIRERQLKSVANTMKRLSKGKQPVFIMGDYNLSATVAAAAKPQQWLNSQGYVDAATAPTALNMNYSTFNAWRGDRVSSLPYGSRIDKIYGRGSKVHFSRYETMIERKPASDHFLIRATAHF